MRVGVSFSFDNDLIVDVRDIAGGRLELYFHDPVTLDNLSMVTSRERAVRMLTALAEQLQAFTPVDLSIGGNDERS